MLGIEVKWKKKWDTITQTFRHLPKNGKINPFMKVPKLSVKYPPLRTVSPIYSKREKLTLSIILNPKNAYPLSK